MDRFSFLGAGRHVAMMGMLLGSAASLAQAASERKLIVADIIISGNKHTATEVIKDLLKSRVGGEYVPDSVQEDVRALLATKQFGNVEARYKDVGGNKVAIYFFVTEAPGVYIRSIEFEGNQFVSGAVLKTHINSKERLLGLFAFLSTPSIPTVGDRDVDELLKYYRSYGFRDVRVSRQIKWDSDGKTVALLFHIHEGQRYRLQGSPASEDHTKTDAKRLENFFGFPGGFFR
jgi:outer membrane protein assembly factor BamA